MIRFVCFYIFILIFPNEIIAQDAPLDVVEAAQSELHTFLSHIPSEARKDFGFSNSDNLDDVVLGEPFNLYTITPEDLTRYKENTPVASILSTSNLWYFPLMLNNKAKALLIVDKIEGDWSAVSLGNTKLAKKLVTIDQKWKSSEGVNPRLIAVFQANQYLLAVPEVNAIGLIRLSPSMSGRDYVLKNSNGEMVMENSFEVIKRLRPIVRGNINDNRHYENFSR